MPSIITSGAMNAKALGFGASSGVDIGDNITKSVRFRSSVTPQLSRTFGTPTNADKWVLSIWYKRSKFGIYQDLFSTGATDNEIAFHTGNEFRIWMAGAWRLTSNKVFRDPAKFGNLIIYCDVANATASLKLRVIDNGQEITSWATDTRSALSSGSSAINTAIAHFIGGYLGGINLYDGYVADVCFIDGGDYSTYPPTTFGRVSADTGAWVHKNPTGVTWGNNGFRHKYDQGSTASDLGIDSSGNSNTFTVTNLSVTAGITNDWLDDTPTNTFPVWNSIDKNASTTLTDGALALTGATTGGRSTFALPTTGKWYTEVTLKANTSGTAAASFGVCTAEASLSGTGPSGVWAWYASANTSMYMNATPTSTSPSYGVATTSTVWQVAYDADNNKLYLGIDNLWYDSSCIRGNGNPSAGTGQTVSSLAKGLFLYGMGVDSSESLYLNCGQRAFAFTPPTGFVALCTANLPTPTIIKSTSYVNTLLYSGTSAVQSVTGSGHMPDLVTMKSRGTTTKQNFFDSVRGVNKGLVGDETAPYTDVNTLTSFDSNGFSLGSDASSRGVNISGASMMAATWKKGTLPGFNIVSYTGNGTAGRTVAHGLGVTPHAWMIHRVDGTNGDWWHYHKDTNATPQNYYQKWSTSGTTVTTASSTAWNNTAPDATNVTLGTAAEVNASGVAYIMYVWVGVEGFSKFGGYTGNGSTDGTFVWLGFEPELIWIHNVSANYYWVEFPGATKTYNGVESTFDPTLVLLTTENTTTTYAQDHISGGFKLRNTDPMSNNSGNNYTYWAWGSCAFKYSNAR